MAAAAERLLPDPTVAAYARADLLGNAMRRSEALAARAPQPDYEPHEVPGAAQLRSRELPLSAP